MISKDVLFFPNISDLRLVESINVELVEIRADCSNHRRKMTVIVNMHGITNINSPSNIAKYCRSLFHFFLLLRQDVDV